MGCAVWGREVQENIKGEELPVRRSGSEVENIQSASPLIHQ